MNRHFYDFKNNFNYESTFANYVIIRLRRKSILKVWTYF